MGRPGLEPFTPWGWPSNQLRVTQVCSDEREKLLVGNSSICIKTTVCT